jgi:NADH-quinone oxidoreductase subunit J
MDPLQLVFLAVAVLILGSAIAVVTSRNLIHSALWLVVALFGVAIIFVLLSAGFLAVAQVLIYIGAIAILFIFAAMLTRRVMQDTGPQTNPNWWLAVVIAALLFGGLAWMLGTWDGFSAQAPALPTGVDPVQQLGTALVNPDAYLIPFEVASVLLLAALVGALVIAREQE